jgi:hypothetical protein
MVIQQAIWYLWKILWALPDTMVATELNLFGGQNGAKINAATSEWRNNYPAHIMWATLFGCDKKFLSNAPTFICRITKLHNPTCTDFAFPIDRENLMLAHSAYFLPLTHAWLQFMNLQNLSSFEEIMRAPVMDLVFNQTKKGLKFGVWSSFYLLPENIGRMHWP